MERDKVFQLIENLLNKTEDRGASPDEAAAAANKVQELLTRYNLELADLHVAANNGPAPGPDITKEWVDISDTPIWYREKNWRRSLVVSVARYNYCKALQSDRSMVIIGTKDNIAVVRELSLWLIDQLDEMARIATKAYAKKMGKWVWKAYQTGDHPYSYRASYLEGAVATIRGRLYSKQKEMEGETDVKALVVRHESYIDDFIKNVFGPLRCANGSSSQYNTAGWAQGRSAANNLDLAPRRRLDSGRKEPLR